MIEQQTVSVIILTYINIAGIFETLDSILAQTYPAVEIVISDDGSPDFASYEPEIRSYINDRKRENIVNVIIISHEKNQGTVKNMNSALKASTGRFVKSLAAEDSFCREDALELYVAFLEKTKRLVCFAKMQGLTEAGEYIYKLASCEYDYKLLDSMNPNELGDRLFRRNCLPAPAWFGDRQLFEKYGYFPETIRLIEDYPYWLHLCQKGVKFGFLDEFLVNYKMTGISSAGHYSVAFMEDLCKIYAEFIFPYDRRFGTLQPLYNFLKRAGLQSYIEMAKWDNYSVWEKIGAVIKYLPFYVYIWAQKYINNIENRKAAKKAQSLQK